MQHKLNNRSSALGTKTSPELHDWQETGNISVDLSWVSRVITMPNSTQLSWAAELS